MASTVTVVVHTKPQPRPLFKYHELYTSEEWSFFKGLRLPKDGGFDIVKVEVHVNKWSLAHAFNFDNQLHLIPTFLGNDPAWMFTWEFSVGVEKEPTSAWRGKYSVWYHHKPEHTQEAGQSEFYLFKQRKAGNVAGGLVLHDDVPWPGPHEKAWFEKETDKIRKVLEEARYNAQWNPPFGKAGLTITCDV